MTGQNVTECTGGAHAIPTRGQRALPPLCDPRLNAEQAIEMAFLMADLLKAERAARAKPLPAVPASDTATAQPCFDSSGRR